MSRVSFEDSIVDEAYIDILHDFLSYPPTWMDEAACIGLERKTDDEDIFQACSTCPVREKCYDYAIENNASSGIFGGKDFS